MATVKNERYKKLCEQCGGTFHLNPRYGLKYSEKTGRGRFCSDRCSRLASRGQRRSKDTEFKTGLAIRWAGGTTTAAGGYVMTHKPTHPAANMRGYVMEHRLVMEAHVGRYLSRGEVVHHRSKDVTDNRLENLQLFENHSEHQKHHHPKGQKFGGHPCQ